MLLRWNHKTIFTLLLAAAILPAGQSALAAGRDVAVPQDENFADSWDGKKFKHDLWDSVLKFHVNEAGLVDYEAMGKDARYREYLHRLANTDPHGLASANARKAFWINAYNALAIYGVVVTLPEDKSAWLDYSVLKVELPGVKKAAFFRGLRFKVGGRRLTLDEIEKGMILQVPEHTKRDPKLFARLGVEQPDPRVHFAVVCCARGCPILQRFAYRGEKLDQQLDAVTRHFASAGVRLLFDQKRHAMRVSKLLEWYGADFTNPRYKPHAKSLYAFFAKYVKDASLARSLRQERWTVTYIDYDWKLNLQS